MATALFPAIAPDLFEGPYSGRFAERGELRSSVCQLTEQGLYQAGGLTYPVRRIQMKDAVLYINGEAVPKELLDESYYETCWTEASFKVPAFM